MNPQPVQWGPGIIVVAAGVVMAIVMLFLLRKGSQPIVEKNDRLADLERRLQALLEQLRELQSEEHLLGEEAFTAEKTRLETEAAAALKARDEYAEALIRANAMAGTPNGGATASAQQTAAAPARGGWKLPVTAAAVIAFFVGLGVLLTEETKPRDDSAMGGPMTGGGAPNAQQQAAVAQEEADFQALQKKAQANPDDLNITAELAHEMLRRQDFTNANVLTERALSADPFHTESRIHREVLRGLKGDASGALQALEAIGAAQPDGDEALLFAGALAMELEDHRRALKNFESYAAAAAPGDQPPQLLQGIALLRQQIAAEEGRELSPVPGPNMPQQNQNVRPPALSQEQMEAFAQAQQNPEFVKAAQGNIEQAEADLAAGRFQDALDKYKQVMPVMPGNTRAQAGMAWALHGLNRQPMADNIWNVAARDPAALDALGDALKSKGDEKGAKALWQKLAATAPDYAAVKSKLQ